MKQVALITGGTRGIGLGIAKELAAKGINLALNGQRDKEEIQATITELESLGVQVIYCQGDISSPTNRKKIIQDIIKKFGAINFLVNNAGVAPKNRKDLLDLEESDYEWLMRINLQGPMFLTQEVSKVMIAKVEADPSFKAAIINITSISAELASINRGEYCISKAGLSMMSKLYAAKLSEYNIPVYEVRPGVIKTDMTASVNSKYQKMIDEGLTLEKRLGDPSDIGKTVAALATHQIPYATGQILNIDGGLMVGRL